jgi:hypothetical protein
MNLVAFFISRRGKDVNFRTTIVTLFLVFQYGFSQSVDSVKSGDSTQVTDTLQVQAADSSQIIDTLQVQSADSAMATDTLQVQPTDSVGSTAIQTFEPDSSQMIESRRIVNVDSLQKAEMKKLHFLQGEWKGEAWTISPNREKHFIIQTEKVEIQQNGLVLTIHGNGIDKKSLMSKPKMVHDAFALLFFDRERQKVQMMAFNKGNRILTEPIVGNDQSMIWGFSLPNTGEVRYTIRLNEQGQWFEIGEFSRDGVQWFKNFEMKLNKLD